MPRAIALRSDFNGVELRRQARRSKDAAQARRLLALAAIYDGGTRSEAARLTVRGIAKRLQCSACGGRNIGVQITADTRGSFTRARDGLAPEARAGFATG